MHQQVEEKIDRPKDSRIKFENTKIFPNSIRGIIKTDTGEDGRYLWGTVVMIAP